MTLDQMNVQDGGRRRRIRRQTRGGRRSKSHKRKQTRGGKRHRRGGDLVGLGASAGLLGLLTLMKRRRNGKSAKKSKSRRR